MGGDAPAQRLQRPGRRPARLQGRERRRLRLPGPRQTFGWKEAEDVLAAGRFLAAQPGVSSIGLVGFSLGGQDTVLALALDRKRVFSAGLNFSGPADQATQVDSTAVPSGCETQRGEHAYFFDRWWQQRAILLYFKNLLPGAAADPTIETGAAVGQTAGGAPAGSQLVDLGSPTRADADALLGPDPCDTARGAPGTAMP